MGDASRCLGGECIFRFTIEEIAHTSLEPPAAVVLKYPPNTQDGNDVQLFDQGFEQEHASWHEAVDTCLGQCNESDYRQAAEALTAITPYWPSEDEWANSELAAHCPLLNKRQTVSLTQMNRMRRLCTDRGQVSSIWEDKLEKQVAAGFLPEEDFRAGGLHQRVQMWQLYCDLAGLGAAEVQLELDMVRQGVTLHWCSPTDEHKMKEPRHKQRLAGVTAQLRKAGYDRREAEGVLTSEVMEPLVFPNLLQRPDDLQFATEQVRKNIACGALLPWPFAGTRPAVVLSLAVVTNSYGKKRLIVDGRPVNLRQQRLPFKYETAADASRMLAGKRWAWTLDVKAGYHHVLLHPREWTYVGIYFDGRFYVHAALPFGLSQAPERFTRLMWAVRGPMVAAGANITGMVDDSMGAAATLPEAAAVMGKQIEVMGLLGWTLNGGKSMKRPEQMVQYLGYEFDAVNRSIALPQEKLQRIWDSLAAARQSRSEHHYRRVAGQMAAASLAFPFTGLMIRTLTLEKERGLSDGDEEDRALHKDLIEFFLDNIRKLNGRPMDAPIRAAQTLVVDTSESATGAHILGTAWKAMIPFDQTELDRIERGRWSSTAAEARGILKALKEGVRCGAIPGDGSGAVQVVCDNKGTVSAMANMRGGKQVFPVVAQVLLFAREVGLVLSFVWQRRNTQEVVLADALSKLQDDSDWQLSKGVVKAQVHRDAQAWVERGYFPPDIDMMASCAAHQVPQYVSLCWDGMCIAKDAMVQDWGRWPMNLQEANRECKLCIFLFPPHRLLTNVLWKIAVEQPTVWLVCSRYLRAIDERYVAALPIKAQFPLQCRDVRHIVKPTRYNPAHKTGEQWHTPLQMLLITWDAGGHIGRV